MVSPGLVSSDWWVVIFITSRRLRTGCSAEVGGEHCAMVNWTPRCSGSTVGCSCRKIRLTTEAKWRFLGVLAFVSSRRTQKSIGRGLDTLVVGADRCAAISRKALALGASRRALG